MAACIPSMGNSSHEPYARGTIRDNKIKSQKT